MIGGSLDVLSTGAVVSNFPARGQGKVFLLNNIEFATAQLWVREDSIKSIADLKGKQISTTTGTTAHVFLDTRSALGQARSAKDVRDRQPAHGRGGDLVRLGRGARGRALGAVRHDREAEGARTRARSSTPPRSSREAAIMGGWAARNDYYDANKPRRGRAHPGWVEVNDAIARTQLRRSAAETLQKTQYTEVPLADFRELDEVLEVLHVGRVAQALRRRHGDQVAAAGDGLLRRRRQHRQNPVPAATTSIRSSTCRP